MKLIRQTVKNGGHLKKTADLLNFFRLQLKYNFGRVKTCNTSLYKHSIFSFSFPDEYGRSVSLNDLKFSLQADIAN